MIIKYCKWEVYKLMRKRVLVLRLPNLRICECLPVNPNFYGLMVNLHQYILTLTTSCLQLIIKGNDDSIDI